MPSAFRAFALALLLASPAAAATQWDMPTGQAEHDFHSLNNARFARDVEAATNGALKITLHTNGSLLTPADIADGVRRGQAPIGEVPMSRLSAEDPIFEIDAVPFLAAGYDKAQALWTQAEPVIRDRLAERGLTLLYAVPLPGQGLFLTERVDDVVQLQGVTFRAYNAATERLATLLGGVPTHVEAAKVPAAFRSGQIGAMITSPSTGATAKAWNFAGYFVDAQAWLPLNIVLANTKALDALPPEQRAAVLRAAAAAQTRGWDMSRAETAEKTKALQDHGITVYVPQGLLADQLAEIGQRMTREWLDRAGGDGEEIINAYQAGL